jgi:hypothetical protein
MQPRQGYRLIDAMGVPESTEPQGIYLLADGTRRGTTCCWTFGNAGDPMSFSEPNGLHFGEGFWGTGEGDGPWFTADFGAGLWAGGSNDGDPGWGSLGAPGPANPDNPSLSVPFALGFLRTDEMQWALRMADTATARGVSTAYEGRLPKSVYNAGGLVLGVGSDNANNSFGTFYEGAVVAGYPTDSAEIAVMENIQAARYEQ